MIDLPTTPFWKQRLYRALSDTLADLSFNRRKSIPKLGVIVVAVGLLWLFGLEHIAKDRLWEILSAVVAILLMCAVLFGMNWILAPGRINREQIALIGQLQKTLEFDRRRLLIKDRIGRAIQEGGALQKECKTTTDRDDLHGRMNSWVNDINAFIHDSLGAGDAQLFNTSSGIMLFSDQNQPNHDLQNAMEWRLQRLVQLLQRVDTAPVNPDFATPTQLHRMRQEPAANADR